MEIISSKIPSGAKSGEGNTCTKSILKQLTFKIVVSRKRISRLAEHVLSTDSLNSAYFSERLSKLTTVVEFMQSYKTKLSDHIFFIFPVPDL